MGVGRRWREADPDRLGQAFLWAAGARLAMLLVPPLLSEDLWRYLWDGAVQHLGYGPFDHAPADGVMDAAVAQWPALADIRDQIGHAEIPTIYPPAAQGVFYVVTAVAPSALLWRFVSSGFELGAAWAMLRWLRAEGRDPRAILLWLFCPLVALESTVGAHVDTLGVLGVALAGALLAVGGPSKALGAGAALALAVGTKLFPAVGLLRAGWRVTAGAGLAAGLLWLPYLAGTSGVTQSSGLARYAQRWQANDGLFAVLSWPFERLYPNNGLPVPLPEPVRAMGRVLVGPAIEVLGGPVAPLWPDEVAFAAAKALSLGLLGLVVLQRFVRARDLAGVLGPVTIALLLVSPVVHPWYLLWILPFAVRLSAGPTPRRAWFFWIWTATVWVAYLPRLNLLATGVWTPLGALAQAEYLPVWIALAFTLRAGVNTAPDGP